jgi:excisionase family DNA binding protein
MPGVDDPRALLQEWFDWWSTSDVAPVKLPRSLHVRTAITLHSDTTFPESVPEPNLLKPEQAARKLGISRTRVYELITTGELPSRKIGRSRRIRLVDLERYVEGLG